MQVKTAELKANLSRYVRQVRETGEPIEILLREETAERRRLEKAFAGAGLACDWPAQSATGQPKPSIAGDGAADIDSTAAMRAEKDW